MEHKFLVLSSRSVADLTENVPKALDDLAKEGWRVVTAYAVADGASTMVQHHFVLQRDPEPVLVAAPAMGKTAVPNVAPAANKGRGK